MHVSILSFQFDIHKECCICPKWYADALYIVTDIHGMMRFIMYNLLHIFGKQYVDIYISYIYIFVLMPQTKGMPQVWCVWTRQVIHMKVCLLVTIL